MDLEIFVVINTEYIPYWNTLCQCHNYQVPHRVVEGGTERFHSVYNALKQINGKVLIGIHDAVRPFVSKRTIENTFVAALIQGNAVPAVPSTNTIRYYDGKSSSKALYRSHIYIIQNPQVFRLTEIKNAYNQPYDPSFLDDATVAESFGLSINLVEGNRENIKITHPIDLVLAKAIHAHKILSQNVLNPI